MLDDVRVYNRELSAAEVLEVMHSARRQSAVYDVAGNLVQKTDRDGRVTQYVYDPLNRQVEENWLDADSNVFHTIHTYYDADGQVLGITESDAQTAAAGTLYQYAYDADGRVTSARMAPGDLAQSVSPSVYNGQLGDGLNNDQLLDWDGDGVSERADTWSFSLTAGVPVLLNLSSTAFDATLIVQRPGGNSSTWLIDGNSGGGTSASLCVYARRQRHVDGLRHLARRDDRRPILLKKRPTPTRSCRPPWSSSTTPTTRRATCSRPRRTSRPRLATGLGGVTTDAYDALDRLTQTKQSVGGTVNKRADFVYNADGSTQSVTRYSNDGTTTVATSSYSYDGMGRLTGLMHTPTGAHGHQLRLDLRRRQPRGRHDHARRHDQQHRLRRHRPADRRRLHLPDRRELHLRRQRQPRPTPATRPARTTGCSPTARTTTPTTAKGNRTFRVRRRRPTARSNAGRHRHHDVRLGLPQPADQGQPLHDLRELSGRQFDRQHGRVHLRLPRPADSAEDRRRRLWCGRGGLLL